MLLAGSWLDRIPGPKYAAQLGFAELGLKQPLPRPATLRRMRGDLSAEFVLALRAPQSALNSARGPLRFDADLERGLQWLLEARAALAAKILVLPTPADLTPGQRDRELLAAFAERLPRAPGQHVVWAPSGPWEVEDAAQVARSLGWVLAFDPLLESLPTQDVVYARLRALGARQSFSQAILEELASKFAGLPEVYVAIDARRSFDHAVQLQRLSSPAPDAA